MDILLNLIHLTDYLKADMWPAELKFVFNPKWQLVSKGNQFSVVFIIHAN